MVSLMSYGLPCFNQITRAIASQESGKLGFSARFFLQVVSLGLTLNPSLSLGAHILYTSRRYLAKGNAICKVKSIYLYPCGVTP